MWGAFLKQMFSGVVQVADILLHNVSVYFRLEVYMNVTYL